MRTRYLGGIRLDRNLVLCCALFGVASKAHAAEGVTTPPIERVELDNGTE